MNRPLLLLIIAALLASCGGTPLREPAFSKKGGYYLDDGPGEREPAGLDALPDAQPRNDPINPYTARPYTVMGKTYVPYAKLTAYKVRGVASWYGKRYNGQRTSSGEIYDMYAMTAAHTVLPLPSYARVTHLASGKSVVVRINDRGPFLSDRVIDLSYAAAKRLGIIGAGRAQVEVEAILPGNTPAALPAAAPSQSAALPPASSSPARSERPGHYLQLGAFSVAGNADDFLKKMQSQLTWLSDSLAVWSRDGLFRVHAGPFPSREQALAQSDRIETELGTKPLILSR